MQHFLTSRYVSLILVVSGLLLLSACTTTADKESNIEERASARWDAILSGDLAKAYEFLSPGYRSGVSSLQYQRAILLRRVQWVSARYLGSECSETVCTVSILLGYSVTGAIPGVASYEGTQEVRESWISIDGLWYFMSEL